MKKTIFLIIILFISFTGFSQGVVFENLSFQEGLNKAKAENKLLFVDCYTSWCGPCRLLSEKIFTQQKVGDYLNEHFVCLKIDMEKGEGPELSKRWEVKSYPTLLLIRTDGVLLHKIIGFQQADELVRQIEEGRNETTSLYYLQQRYESGNRDKKEIVGYLQLLTKNHETGKVLRISEDFMNSLTEEQKKDPELWPIYSNPVITEWGSSCFTFLLGHKADFIQSVGEENVDRVIYEVTTDMFMTMLFKNKNGFTKDYLPQYIKELRGLEFKDREVVCAEAEFTQALFDQDAQKTEELYKKYGKKFTNKGVTNLFPLILQTKDSIDKENFKASWKMIELLEATDKTTEK